MYLGTDVFSCTQLYRIFLEDGPGSRWGQIKSCPPISRTILQKKSVGQRPRQTVRCIKIFLTLANFYFILYFLTGNNVSLPPVLPSAFGDCFNDGQLDINKFQMHLFVKRKREENLHQLLYVPASCPNDTPAAKKEEIAHAKETN